MEPADNQLPGSSGSTTEEAINHLTPREVDEPLEKGPYGAMLLASIAVGLLFVGWLLFYFVLFLRRGYIG
jgi:hypothetical protein